MGMSKHVRNEKDPPFYDCCLHNFLFGLCIIPKFKFYSPGCRLCRSVVMTSWNSSFLDFIKFLGLVFLKEVKEFLPSSTFFFFPLGVYPLEGAKKVGLYFYHFCTIFSNSTGFIFSTNHKSILPRW